MKSNTGKIKQLSLLLFPSFIVPLLFTLVSTSSLTLILGIPVAYLAFELFSVVIGWLGLHTVIFLIRKMYELRGCAFCVPETQPSGWEGGNGGVKDFFKSIGFFLKKSGYFFVALFGFEIWISSRIQGIPFFGGPFILLAFGLVGIGLPITFYAIWGVQSAGMTLYQREPLHIQRFGAYLDEKIVSISMLSLLIYVVRKAYAWQWEKLGMMLAYDIVFLLFFSPFVYFLTAFYYLFLQNRHPNLYAKLKDECPTCSDLFSLEWSQTSS